MIEYLFHFNISWPILVKSITHWARDRPRAKKYHTMRRTFFYLKLRDDRCQNDRNGLACWTQTWLKTIRKQKCIRLKSFLRGIRLRSSSRVEALGNKQKIRILGSFIRLPQGAKAGKSSNKNECFGSCVLSTELPVRFLVGVYCFCQWLAV